VLVSGHLEPESSGVGLRGPYTISKNTCDPYLDTALHLDISMRVEVKLLDWSHLNFKFAGSFLSFGFCGSLFGLFSEAGNR
jgi:hypothetical protein